MKREILMNIKRLSYLALGGLLVVTAIKYIKKITTVTEPEPRKKTKKNKNPS